jgi:hypothetical protein
VIPHPPDIAGPLALADRVLGMLDRLARPAPLMCHRDRARRGR